MTDLNPSDVLSDRPQGPTREQTQKTVHDKFPGHIAWATDRANFSGCRIVKFTDDDGAYGLSKEDAAKFREQIIEYINQHTMRGEESPDLMAEDLANLYFSTRSNLLVVHSEIGEGYVALFVTTQLDEDDLDEFMEVQRRVNIDMAEWRKQRDADREARAEQARENLRLIEVGRKAEEYGWAKKNRELEEANEELQDYINELEAAFGDDIEEA